MKFRKVKNEQRWVAKNGTVISYNYIFDIWMIERKLMFESAKSFEEAKEIASSDFRFNKD